MWKVNTCIIYIYGLFFYEHDSSRCQVDLFVVLPNKKKKRIRKRKEKNKVISILKSHPGDPFALHRMDIISRTQCPTHCRNGYPLPVTRAYHITAFAHPNQKKKKIFEMNKTIFISGGTFFIINISIYYFILVVYT